MITRTKDPSTVKVPITERWTSSSYRVTGSSTISNGADTITYAEGPRYLSNHNNWKECYHTLEHGWSYSLPEFRYKHRSTVGEGGVIRPWLETRTNPVVPSIPDDAVRQSLDQCWSQLDLNCRSSVLLYSGIIQAIPLLGGILALNRMLSRASRRLSKSARKRPFTAVVKTLIGLDFIDRFVLRPTLDDARKFIDASNYVLNVLRTAYERNAMPTAVRGGVHIDISKVTQGYSVTTSQNSIRVLFEGFSDTNSFVEANCFLLCDAHYNTAAIDPIKLWATRCGLYRPLDAAWDLLPFSFVVDYFTRAGDFISGIGNLFTDQDALRGKITNVRGCWVTSKTVSLKQWRFVSLVPRNLRPYVVDESHPTGSYKVRSEIFSRVPLNPFAYPSSGSDYLHLDLSLTRWRTIAQLIVQRYLR